MCHGHIPANPLLPMERVPPDPLDARVVRRAQVDAMLAMIPPRHLRDRLCFRLLVETGLRVSEARELYVEDLDLRRDEGHLRVVGNGAQRRTGVRDDPSLVLHLRKYRKQTGYGKLQATSTAFSSGQRSMETAGGEIPDDAGALDAGPCRGRRAVHPAPRPAYACDGPGHGRCERGDHPQTPGP